MSSTHLPIPEPLILCLAGIPTGEDMIVAYSDIPDSDEVELLPQVLRRAGVIPPERWEVAEATYLMVVISSQLAQPYSLIVVVAYAYREEAMVLVVEPGGTTFTALDSSEWSSLHFDPSAYQLLLTQEV